MKTLLQRTPLYRWYTAQQRRHERLEATASLYKGEQRILEIGSGEGPLSKRLLVANTSSRFVGLDWSPARVRGYVTHPTATQRLRGVVFNLNALKPEHVHLPFRDGSFDLVLLANLIEHIAWPHIVLGECHRVLADRGALLISTPNLVNLENRLSLLLGHGGNLFYKKFREPLAAGIRFRGDGHIAHYTRRSLAQLLNGMGFDTTRVRFAELTYPGLSYFQWALMRLVPQLAEKLIVKAVKRPMAHYRVFYYDDCPFHGFPQLILPGNRCISPTGRGACTARCPYYHTEWLDRRDARKGSHV